MASVASEDGDHVSLNVMPMLDIFSILILFLLMNFGSDPMNYDLTKGVELPESLTSASLDEVPSIMLTRDKLFVNDKQIAEIVDGDIAEKYREQGGVNSLLKEMVKLSEANDKYSKDKKNVRAVTIEVDRRLEFKLLRRVMFTAKQTDFVKFKLMVSKRL